MAILAFGGAEDGLLDVIVSGTVVQSSTVARTGTYSYRLKNGSSDFANLISLAFPPRSTTFTQFGLYTNEPPSSDRPIFGWRFGSAVLGCITVDTGNTGMKLWRGLKTTQLATAGVGLIYNAWMLFEAKIVLDNTNGLIQIKLNGVIILEYTGDTLPGSDTTCNNIILGSHCIYEPQYSYVDDILVVDDQGSYFNSWCNGAKIHKCLPTAAGNYSQWTPAGASYNYQCMDDVTPSMTDYISSTTAGEKDSYTIADSPVGVIGIGAVALRYWGQGDGQVKSLIRSGGIDYVGTAIEIPGSFNKVDEVHYTAPQGGGWNTTIFNALEVGLEKV